jgi:putative iron-dependent peroxidase
MATPAAAQGMEEPESQPVTAPLTPAAIFLVVSVNPGEAAEAAVKAMCPDLANLLRAVGFRDLDGRLSCIMAFGSAIWDRLFGDPKPTELHPFRELGSGARHAPATPGDILFHIRAQRMDLCFELATLILTKLGTAVRTEDEVHGFAYFDQRDLLGFVDGTENPTGSAADNATRVGPEDANFAGGSYVIVQKYLHDLDGWNALPAETQEGIIGRTKLANVELEADMKPSYAHAELTKIVEDGEEIKIVRANMPFGAVGTGEFGTYFIGYSRSPKTIEQMLDNMFIGRPSGNYDRILDFSRAVTGGLFFAPAPAFLDAAGAAPISAATAAPAAESASPARDGSLGIGSLKGNPQNEQSAS